MPDDLDAIAAEISQRRERELVDDLRAIFERTHAAHAREPEIRAGAEARAQARADRRARERFTARRRPTFLKSTPTSSKE